MKGHATLDEAEDIERWAILAEYISLIIVFL